MPSLQLTPARRSALIVGVPIALALIGWGALNAVAFLGQGTLSINRTIASGADAVSFSVDSGDLTLTPSDDNDVHIAGTVTYSLVKPTLSVNISGSHVTITESCHLVVVGNCLVHVTVAVPADAASVTASSLSGTVSASGLTNVSLESDSGDVRVVDVHGETHLRTDSGDISATGLSSTSVIAHDDSGDVSLDFFEAPQQVTVQDSSGDVTLTLPRDGTAYKVDAHTDSGTTTIDVPTDPASANIVSVSVASGDVHIGVSA
jgi:hypothetical protein